MRSHVAATVIVAALQVATIHASDGATALLPSHFPDVVHAVVFRNWNLVPTAKLADALACQSDDILRIGRSMGLPDPPVIDADRVKRSFITVIRRNWHLLPDEQIRQLLGWNEATFRFVLREDDFLEIKLGAKRKLAPARFHPPSPEASKQSARIAKIIAEEFPAGIQEFGERPFEFVRRLSALPQHWQPKPKQGGWSPRFCYSYFALYGDPLLEVELDPFPEGLLARLVDSGADGVWLQGVLYKLAPFPWSPRLSEGWPTRLANLKALVARGKRFGVDVYLYLNEPRTMPVDFFADKPDLRGVVGGEFATMCTSHPDVRRYLADSVATICRAVPDLAGIFTITASENMTHCWSHYRGKDCPRCAKRKPGEVIGEVNAILKEGIDRAGSKTRFIAWDWGWRAEDVAETIAHLPKGAYLQSVSEWDQPIIRGGVANRIGEYCLTTHGPGPRASRHWKLAKEAGLKPQAKIQANCTWELASLPWLPVGAMVARHAVALRKADVEGVMLGWTLGGHPSPNLEIVAAVSADPKLTVEAALDKVATARFGKAAAADVVAAWESCTAGIGEFPYDGSTVYNGPQNVGPANLLWAKPTGMRATMVCYPFDDLSAWRSLYPEEVFIRQLEKTAAGFEQGAAKLRAAIPKGKGPHRFALVEEATFAEAAGIHFRSSANQASFVRLRNRAENKVGDNKTLLALLRAELQLAKRLHALQNGDSRIGFEASNHYFYLPLDLVEKVVNCRELIEGMSGS